MATLRMPRSLYIIEGFYANIQKWQLPQTYIITKIIYIKHKQFLTEIITKQYWFCINIYYNIISVSCYNGNVQITLDIQLIYKNMQRKQIEIINGTDMNLVGEVEQQYYDVMKILIDPELDGLKSRIQILYTNLTEHLETEQNHIHKCKMNKGDIEGYQARITTCNKIIQDELQRADQIKKYLQKMENQTEELKKKQNDIRDVITRHKLQMNIYDKQSIKGLEQIEIKQQNQENELKKKYQEQMKVRQQLMTKYLSLQNQQKFGKDQIDDIRTVQREVREKINALTQIIKQIQIRNDREKKNDQQKKDELNRAKNEKDEKRDEKNKLQIEIKQLDTELVETAEQLKTQKKNKQQNQRVKNKLQKQKEQVERQFYRKTEQKDKLQNMYDIKKRQKEVVEAKLRQLQKQQLQTRQELIFASTKLQQAQSLNGQLIKQKNEVLSVKQIQIETLEKLNYERERNKSLIKQLIAKRIEQDKIAKVAQNKQHEINLQNLEQLNKFKKVSNEVASYQVEDEKLRKILSQIKRQQEKYGIEASHAHSKYYQTLEQLKTKNTQIQNLQKQNLQVEKKCKHQQNLYEAVRSDRNLYSKDFIKSKEQINELKKKYERMTRAVQQLRVQIKSKDQQLVQLDKQFKKIQSENVKIQADKNRAKSQINSTQQVIKNQENHVGHLKKIIQEAKNQKAKQQKDYDMVRNERDILGTQLIKRNQQLSQLYEKIKLSNSNLTKGQIYFKQKQKEFNENKIKLAVERNEFLSVDDKIRCIDDLKAQISFKEKQLLNQKAKVKALEDQLNNPMNVHRWRKLEATDQQNYERILKIQTLQRRLIAKTQQVQTKQNLIREKQKLFLQLKNILARQPGNEIHEQLVKYKDALKEKTGQMKKMKKQLEDAHEQMNNVKFEVDRLKNQMGKMKREYFELRQDSEKQVMNQRNFGQQIVNMGSGGDDKMFEINLKK